MELDPAFSRNGKGTEVDLSIAVIHDLSGAGAKADLNEAEAADATRGRCSGGF